MVPAIELTNARFATSVCESFGATERETHARGCAGQVRNRVPGAGDESLDGNVEDAEEAWRASVPSKEVLSTSLVDVTATPHIAAECAKEIFSKSMEETVIPTL